MSEQAKALLRQVYGMAREGCDSPGAAYRWCERIDEVLHAGEAMDDYTDYALDLPPATEAALSAPAQENPDSTVLVGEAAAFNYAMVHRFATENSVDYNALSKLIRECVYTTPPAPSAADACLHDWVTDGFNPAMCVRCGKDMATTPTEDKGGAWPDDGAYLIRFDDAEREDESFVGCGAKDAALRYYEQVSDSWNAHLYVKVDSNSRDCTVPNGALAATAPQAPVAGEWVQEARQIIDELIQCANVGRWDGKLVRAAQDLLAAAPPALTQPVDTVTIDGRTFDKEVVRTALLGLAADLASHPAPSSGEGAK